jgi:hypothetical protein
VSTNAVSAGESIDFNGDGTSDIIWHDNAGNVAVWLMNGANVSVAQDGDRVAVARSYSAIRTAQFGNIGAGR